MLEERVLKFELRALNQLELLLPEIVNEYSLLVRTFLSICENSSASNLPDLEGCLYSTNRNLIHELRSGLQA